MSQTVLPNPQAFLRQTEDRAYGELKMALNQIVTSRFHGFTLSDSMNDWGNLAWYRTHLIWLLIHRCVVEYFKADESTDYHVSYQRFVVESVMVRARDILVFDWDDQGGVKNIRGSTWTDIDQ